MPRGPAPVANPLNYGTCVVTTCRRTLVYGSVWTEASKEQRAAWKAAGKARAVRKDMCSACHQRLRTNGELDRYTTQTRRNSNPADTRWEACLRCGHPERHAGVLCRDCLDVTHDLNEREKWAA